MRTIYTEAGERELAAFEARQRETLETLIAERKSVLGDDVLEITASDVRDVASRLRIHRIDTRPVQSTYLVTRLYVAIGLLTMAGGILYPQIAALIAESRTQFTVIVAGAAMTIAGLLLNYWISLRHRQHDLELHRFLVLERLRSQDLQELHDEDSRPHAS